MRERPPVRLAGLPRARSWESPASWLSRAALQQGVKPADLLSLLGLTASTDVDRALISKDGRAMRSSCGMEDRFELTARLLTSLNKVDPKGQRFLLPSIGGRARYRYCPRCLEGVGPPMLPIHCRFVTWRYCPVHACLLEDACPHCGVALLLPAPLLIGGPKREGVATLAHCQSCARSLSVGQAVDLHRVALSDMDQVLLRNGRASLAALFHGYVDHEGRMRGSVRELNTLYKMGVLPHRLDRFDARVLRAQWAAEELDARVGLRATADPPGSSHARPGLSKGQTV